MAPATHAQDHPRRRRRDPAAHLLGPRLERRRRPRHRRLDLAHRRRRRLRLGLLRADGAGFRRRRLAADEPAGPRGAVAGSRHGWPRRPASCRRLFARRARRCQCARPVTRCCSRRWCAGSGRPRCTSCRRWLPRAWRGSRICWAAGWPRRGPASAAAVLVATTPIVLFQAVQPMNDITTGALWLAVAVAMTARASRRRRQRSSGVGAARAAEPGRGGGTAVVVGTAWVCALPRRPIAARRFVRALIAGGLAAVPGDRWWRWRSTGGSTARRSSRATATWACCLRPRTCRSTCCATAARGSRPARRWCCWPCVAVARRAAGGAPRPWPSRCWRGALSIVYLAYRPFDEWWFLRFLLPAVALAAVLTAARRCGPPRVGLAARRRAGTALVVGGRRGV